MKKFLILLSFICIPSYALCPIEAGESVCTLPDLDSSLPLFQSSGSSSNINNTQIQLQPMKKEGATNKINLPGMNNMNYNTGCQFGNCIQDLNNTYNKSQ